MPHYHGSKTANFAHYFVRVFVLIYLSYGIWASAQTVSTDCSTLRYKRHKSASLCGEAHVCSGDICLRPTDFDFDPKFEVVLRDTHGNKLESRTLTYENQKFCFPGHKDGDYHLAFVLYKNGVPQSARVFPARYRRDTNKPNDVYYMVEAVCPD